MQAQCHQEAVVAKGLLDSGISHLNRISAGLAPASKRDGGASSSDDDELTGELHDDGGELGVDLAGVLADMARSDSDDDELEETTSGPVGSGEGGGGTEGGSGSRLEDSVAEAFNPRLSEEEAVEKIKSTFGGMLLKTFNLI